MNDGKAGGPLARICDRLSNGCGFQRLSVCANSAVEFCLMAPTETDLQPIISTATAGRVGGREIGLDARRTGRTASAGKTPAFSCICTGFEPSIRLQSSRPLEWHFRDTAPHRKWQRGSNMSLGPWSGCTASKWTSAFRRGIQLTNWDKS